MDRNRIRQIVLEEVTRVLIEMHAERANHAHSLSGGLLQRARELMGSTPMADPGFGAGAVLLTGRELPGEVALEAIDRVNPVLRIESISFRESFGKNLPARLRNIQPAAGNEPLTEGVIAERIRILRWIVAPDLSLNSLHKLALGIEDSGPTQWLGRAIDKGLPILLLESRPSPLPPDPGAERLELLRKLERRRGCVLCSPSTLKQKLKAALDPPETRRFKPPIPKPPVRLPVLTVDDLYEAKDREEREIVVSENCIVTAEATEQAQRMKIVIRRQVD